MYTFVAATVLVATQGMTSVLQMGHNWSKAPQIVLFEYRLQQCKDNDDLSQFNSTCLGSVEARRRLKLYQFDFTKESKLDPTQLFIRAATNQQCF